MKQLLQTLTVFTLLITSAFAQTITTQEFFYGMNEKFIAGAKQFGMEGAALSMILPSDSAATLYHGLRGTDLTIDPNRSWHAAAATNMFTAYIVMQLVNENELALDDNIGKYLDTKNMANISGSITIRELLTSTSGLSEVYSAGTETFRAIWDDRATVWEPRNLIAYTPEANPAKTFNYCNTNGYILGFLIEDVTGNTLAEEFEDRIFTPFEFSNASIASGKEFDMTKINGVYFDNDERGAWNHTSYMSSRGGNGALVAQPGDIANFMSQLFNGDLLSIDNIKMMLEKTEGSAENMGAMMCAKKITQYRGFQISIIEVIHENGDTTNWVGHAGNGINNIVAYHWIEGDFTIVVVNNDFSTAMTQGALFFDLACYAVSNLDLISDPVSIAKAKDLAQIAVYPNPANQQLSVSMNAEITSIRIFDAFGKIVYLNNNTNGKMTTINLPADLQSGNYFISIEHKNGVATKRLAVLK